MFRNKPATLRLSKQTCAWGAFHAHEAALLPEFVTQMLATSNAAYVASCRG